MPTERTLDQAKDYIDESIDSWIFKGEEKKVISLASMAEKWRSKTINPKIRMRELQKNINQLNQIILRTQKLNPDADVKSLKYAIDGNEFEYTKLVEIPSEIKTKTKIKKTIKEIKKKRIRKSNIS